MFFQKEVDLNNKSAMIQFLKNHYRYYTTNSWSHTNFANNVKLHNLGLPCSKEFLEKAYDFLNAECEEYDYRISDLIAEFENETGYSAGFNGRSGGYIVMYNTVYHNNKHSIMPGRSVCHDEDYETFDIDELQYWTRLVQRFDKLCDDIRDLFIETVTDCDIRSETIYIPQTKLIAVV